jgi:hypothetical protein
LKKEEVKMKKIVVLVIGLMLVASLAFGQGIKKEDLPALKGTYTGWATFQAGITSPMELQILNDAVPVKAKGTISNLPDSVAPLFGQLAKPGGTFSFSGEDGKITNQGSLFFPGVGGNFIELWQKPGNRLDGWFYVNGVRGDASFKKK